MGAEAGVRDGGSRGAQAEYRQRQVVAASPSSPFLSTLFPVLSLSESSSIWLLYVPYLLYFPAPLLCFPPLLCFSRGSTSALLWRPPRLASARLAVARRQIAPRRRHFPCGGRHSSFSVAAWTPRPPGAPRRHKNHDGNPFSLVGLDFLPITAMF